MNNKLLIGIVIAVFIFVLGGLFYLRSLSNKSLTDAQVSKIATTPATLENRVSTLEDAVALIINRVNNLGATTFSGSSFAPASPDADTRLKSLESTVANLQVQINVLKNSNTITTTSSVSKSPIYIPLGWVASSTGIDWTSTNQSIVIDPADYPGYSSMEFDVNLAINQGNGTAYARILDKEDGLAAPLSEVSSTSYDYTWVYSKTFNLPSTAKKTYFLQLKTTTGYAALVQNARIKVNF